MTFEYDKENNGIPGIGARLVIFVIGNLGSMGSESHITCSPSASKRNFLPDGFYLQLTFLMIKKYSLQGAKFTSFRRSSSKERQWRGG